MPPRAPSQVTDGSATEPLSWPVLVPASQAHLLVSTLTYLRTMSLSEIILFHYWSAPWRPETPQVARTSLLGCALISELINAATWIKAQPRREELLWVLGPSMDPEAGGSFPCGSAGKECACHAGDLGSMPGFGRSPGGGRGNPLQYACLENPRDRGAWRATVHGVEKSRTRLSKQAQSAKDATVHQLLNR